jgi:uncharacterized protein YjbI with pentapeptide repeats
MEGETACLAHVDSRPRKGFLAALKPGSDLDLRGVPIDRELLGQLLAALQSQDKSLLLGHVRLDRARFNVTAEFQYAQFNGAVCFDGTQFYGDAWFMGTTFNKTASFQAAQFSGNAQFSNAQFNGDARLGGVWFKEARFSEMAWFHEAQLKGVAWFDRAIFNGGGWFNGTHFSKLAWFRRAQFSGHAEFSRTRFGGHAQFSGTRFGGTASFNRAQFERAEAFGPVFISSRLDLDRATFERDILIEAVGSSLVIEGTRFAGAAVVRLRYIQVVLDGAVFTKPSTIAFAPDTFKDNDLDRGVDVELFDEGPVAQVEGGRSSRPRLLSLRGVNVAQLTLSEVDLTACLFQGAHHLDQLRIEGARPFADSPGSWRLHLGHKRVVVWRRWERRQTLAEEHHWRSKPTFESGPGRWLQLTRPAWHGPARQTPTWVAERTRQRVQRLSPDRLAALYRALRKAQEDSKNEPGAADFYYGEMEMRRHDQRTPWAERMILWAYWLVSGYGLRGLRALAWLAAVVVALAGLLQTVGFNLNSDPSFRDALIYATQNTISIASGNKTLTEHVSWAGEVVRIALRLIGPILLGLALLSVRNRVKR